jgi:hypothetical protein
MNRIPIFYLIIAMFFIILTQFCFISYPVVLTQSHLYHSLVNKMKVLKVFNYVSDIGSTGIFNTSTWILIIISNLALEYFHLDLFYILSFRAGDMAQVVKYLPSKCKALSSNPSTERKKSLHFLFQVKFLKLYFYKDMC